MRCLIATGLSVLIISILLANAQSVNTESSIDTRLTRIQSVINEQGEPINSDDYIFYCTGHHGIVWSLITSDSSGISLYNGTTRDHIDYANQSIPDTLSFINDNIKAITWGMDSLANAAQFLSPVENAVYNPIYTELFIIKDGKISFSYNPRKVFYNRADSIQFNTDLNRLFFLMYWLSAPECRPYLPLPSDTLSLK